MEDAKSHFENKLYYEDKENTFHPDQVDKLQDIDTIKTYYRAMYGMLDFHRKNDAKMYLSLMEEKKSKAGEKKE